MKVKKCQVIYIFCNTERAPAAVPKNKIFLNINGNEIDLLTKYATIIDYIKTRRTLKSSSKSRRVRKQSARLWNSF